MQSARALAVPLIAAVAVTATLAGQQPATDSSKANFERVCGTCHEPDRGTSTRRTRAQWLQTVNQMVARGHFSGVSVANGRVHIGTFDGMLYCFGL